MPSLANQAPWSHIITAIISGMFGYVTRVILDKKASNRKEDRDSIDKITSLAEEIERDCYQYFCSLDVSEESKSLAHKITCSINSVGRRVNNLANTLNDRSAKRCMVAYRQSITRETFDSKTRTLLHREHPTLIDISEKTRILIGHLEIKYHNKYRR